MALVEPKKPQSSYFLYLNDVRSSIQAELGTKELGKVAKEASSRWNSLAAPQKQKYEKLAEEAKQQYTKDLEAFKAAGGEAGKARKDKKDAKAAKQEKADTKEANKDKPKKPAAGAYGVFSNKNRAEIMKSLPAGSGVAVIGKAISEKWKALSDADKKPYEEEYKQLKAKYEEELKAWKDSKAADEEPAAPPTEQSPAKPSPAKAKVAAKKRSESEATPGTPPAKKAKGRGKGAQAAKASPDGPVIDASVLEQAVSLKLDGALKNLAGRQEIKHLSHDKMLSALQSSGGLVNKAKASLLGA